MSRCLCNFDFLDPVTFVNLEDLDTLYINPCTPENVATPTTWYQTFDLDVPTGQYTILSLDMLLGIWGAWNDSGQFLAADWDVTYNV